MLRYDKIGIWNLACKMAEDANQDGTLTFGQLAEKYGVRIEDICFAVTRHWPWKNGQYVYPIIPSNPPTGPLANRQGLDLVVVFRVVKTLEKNGDT